MSIVYKILDMMFNTLHIFTRKRFLQCKVLQVKVFFGMLCSQTFDRH